MVTLRNFFKCLYPQKIVVLTGTPKNFVIFVIFFPFSIRKFVGIYELPVDDVNDIHNPSKKNLDILATLRIKYRLNQLPS